MTVFGRPHREFKEVQSALGSLDAELARISLIPGNPESLERCVRAMKEAIDEKARQYPSNELVRILASESKETFERRLRQQAKKQGVLQTRVPLTFPSPDR